MSENPAYPDAPPTAPGGMSQKALAEELIEKHGWSKATVREWRDGKAWRVGSWPEMIDAVIQERRLREQEAKQEQAVEVEDDLDPESFFAELAEARAEAVEPEPEQASPLFIGMPDTQDFIFDGHAGASPSGAERWMNCTMSLSASREFLETLTPNQQAQFASGSDAARQGTTAHAAAETEALVILGQIDQAEADATLLELAIMPETDGEAYDEEMAEYITEYVDLVKQYADSGRTVLIEQRVEAAVALVGLFEDEVYGIQGSADCIALPSDDEPELVVADLKYGDGIHVDVDENPQVRIYGLGALALLVDEEGNLTADVERVVYHIVQPRLGGIKTWSESIEDLLTWRDEVLAPALSAALAGAEGGATYNPSDETCQWCPARGGCPALAEQRLNQAADLFDTVVEAEFANGPGSFPETHLLTDTRLGELLAQISGLIDIHKDLKEEAQRRLFRGGSVPGFKLVSYTPPRRWSSDAAETLSPDNGDHGLLTQAQAAALWKEPSLVTPTQAIALLKKGGLDTAETVLGDLVVAPDKRPVIAPEGDRRKDWEGTPPEQMFEDEEEGVA